MSPSLLIDLSRRGGQASIRLPVGCCPEALLRHEPSCTVLFDATRCERSYQLGGGDLKHTF